MRAMLVNPDDPGMAYQTCAFAGPSCLRARRRRWHKRVAICGVSRQPPVNHGAAMMRTLRSASSHTAIPYSLPRGAARAICGPGPLLTTGDGRTLAVGVSKEPVDNAHQDHRGLFLSAGEARWCSRRDPFRAVNKREGASERRVRLSSCVKWAARNRIGGCPFQIFRRWPPDRGAAGLKATKCRKRLRGRASVINGLGASPPSFPQLAHNQAADCRSTPALIAGVHAI
jgi:hypothetical protein